MTSTLAVPRLAAGPYVLRAFEPGDVGLVREAAADPYIPLVTTVPCPFTREDGLAFIARQHARARDGEGYPMVIVDRAGDRPVGSIGVWLRDFAVGRSPCRLRPGHQAASVRTWLYRIATTRCLNALRSANRRPAKQWDIPDIDPPEPTRIGEVVWLEPYPDALLEGAINVPLGPEAHYEQTEAISLAFVTALQVLPARQRTVLILRDVLGYHANEVAARGLQEDTIAPRERLVRRFCATNGTSLCQDVGSREVPFVAQSRECTFTFLGTSASRAC
ncbi:hypothetical protein ACTMTJ_34895 [Phytohabitans sp. LJ34]|uniref:GNAT family N-acetyltransferase n=1 Tax=Phytohabitans sp. LJ34 TaxID=3452217 RepID=UPI003F8C86A9